MRADLVNEKMKYPVAVGLAGAEHYKKEIDLLEAQKKLYEDSDVPDSIYKICLIRYNEHLECQRMCSNKLNADQDIMLDMVDKLITECRDGSINLEWSKDFLDEYEGPHASATQAFMEQVATNFGRLVQTIEPDIHLHMMYAHIGNDIFPYVIYYGAVEEQPHVQHVRFQIE